MFALALQATLGYLIGMVLFGAVVISVFLLVVATINLYRIIKRAFRKVKK